MPDFKPVTDPVGNKGFWGDGTFIPLEQMKKVTSPDGVKGYYSDKTGFIPDPNNSEALAQSQAQPWYKKAWPWAEKNIVRPGLEYGGMAVGATLGGAGGTLIEPIGGTAGGGVIGAGLGYAGGKKVADIIENYTGLKKPEPPKQQLVQSAKDVVTGAAVEAGGQMVGPLIQTAIQKSGLPEMVYKSAAKLSTTLKPEERAAITRTLIKEKLPLTPKSYDVLRERVGTLNAQIDKLIAPVANTRVSFEVVAKEAEGAITKAKAGAEPGTDTQKITELIDKYRKEWGGNLTVGQAQTIKQDLGARLERYFDSVKKGGPGMLTDAEVNTMNAVRRGLKKAIEQAVPGVKALNAREGSLLNAQDYLLRATNRIENRNALLSARSLGGATIGALGGLAADHNNPKAALTGALMGMAASPENASRLAIGLDRLGTSSLAKDVLWNPNYMRWLLAQKGKKNRVNEDANPGE